MARLDVVVTSTRPGRVGQPVGDWFRERAEKHGGFDVRLVDLVDVGLPLFDEPHHPRLRTYEHEHTRRWSEIVDAADAFVFVIAEYNHGITAGFKNALDYLSQEWAYKPVGFVSYGGVAAGTRALQMAKPIVSALRMVPVGASVSIPFVHSLLGPDGALAAGEALDASAQVMLDELDRLTSALASLR
jgi:NAD(P)H-dependent FMN reductase